MMDVVQETPDDQGPVRGRPRIGRGPTLVVCALVGTVTAVAVGDRPFLEAVLVAVAIGAGVGLLIAGTMWWFGRPHRDL